MLKVLIRTDTRYPIDRKSIKKAIFDTLSQNRMEESDVEVSVFVVGSRKMRELSNKYFKDEKIHEVLSFPLEDFEKKSGGFINPPGEVLRLGDVVLCYPEILMTAASDGMMVDEEIYRLTMHSMEHLLGMHHED